MLKSINKKMRYILFFIVFLVSNLARAGEGDYAVSMIPSHLLKNANAVKRYEEKVFTIYKLDDATLYHKYAYTILNEKGDQFAKLIETYDKLSTIDFIDGTLYDAAGKKIKTLKKADIRDYSGSDEGSLADDNRLKAHNFYHKNYPYTVEYEVKIDFKHTMFFPNWIPVEDELMSVAYSQLKVVASPEYALRYKNINYPNPPTELSEKGKKIYLWELKNYTAIQDEYAMPPSYEVTPAVFLAPSKFYIQGYEGNMSDWLNFGKFREALLDGRDVLPDDIKLVVHQLTDTITSTKKKIEVLYKYMQRNTRYISIQLGIGGWQPFDADYVAKKKFGDCKALSNFMKSLLKEAGIKSYYTVIKAGAGRHDFIPDFSMNQFNHAILCAINDRDTTWLECTSQTKQPGYMGDFTGNRFALMITDDGGKLVKTPHYGVHENTQTRNVAATMNPEGTLSINAVTRYNAVQQDNLHEVINGLSKERVLEILKNEIDLPQFDLTKFEYKEATENRLPSLSESLELVAPNYAQVSGKRLFIAPNLLTKMYRRLSVDTARKYPVQLNFAYADIDTVEIKIPAGYIPEALPSPVSVSGKFGNYTCSVKIEGDKIFYYRKLENFSGRFPAADYNELVKFREQVYKADRNKVVMVKKE
jgi:hypothetical protein